MTVLAPASARYSPGELASALGLFEPTEEQAAVIAAPSGPLVVIAGAGAGKTETMAARVVWLVANGYAEPGQVLGLTFTRKAAGQLLRRVRSRLARSMPATGSPRKIRALTRSVPSMPPAPVTSQRVMTLARARPTRRLFSVIPTSRGDPRTSAPFPADRRGMGRAARNP